MGRAVAVVLISVVVAAACSEKQASQWKQHDAGEKHGAEIEAGGGCVHKIDYNDVNFIANWKGCGFWEFATLLIS